MQNNSIPNSVLLYGCPTEKARNASFYVWTADDKKANDFNEYLVEVRKHPTRLPLHKLYNIISTIITLTKYIKSMHSSGLLNLDIKPTNLLFCYNSEFGVPTSNVSLFNIDTIYPMSGFMPKASDIDGYRAPETWKGKSENRSDIYSIGVLLFNAIIICDEIVGGLFKEEYYFRIDQLINSSALLSAINLNSFFYSIISRMLKKCLARRVQQRYSCCEELIDDLSETKTILLSALANHSK